MTVTINGSGTMTGLAVGGLNDNIITPAELSTGAPSWDSSGNLSFNSGYGSVATAYACRAWVNFNGQGAVSIRASGNVSSITDVAVGKYRVNFSTAMPDANICVTGMPFNNVGTQVGNSSLETAPTTTNSGEINTWYKTTASAASTANFDPEYVYIAIFR